MIVVIDTETCGFEPPKSGGGVVELAYAFVDDDANEPDVEEFDSWLVKPDAPIELGALATHHITEEMVADASPLDEVLQTLALDNFDYRAAHNAAFDSKFLPAVRGEWICTWRVANHLWPKAPGHSNQVLRYWLGVDHPQLHLLPPHRALPDAICTALILCRMLEQHSAEELLALTKKPILLRTARFGKHRGEEWSRVPRDYMKWALEKSDLCAADPDLRYTLEYHLR